MPSVPNDSQTANLICSGKRGNVLSSAHLPSIEKEAASFFAEVGLNPLPNSKDVVEKIRGLKGRLLAKYNQLILDLQATKISELWPGQQQPPCTKEGIIWHAATSLLNIGKRTEAATTKKNTSNGRRKGASNYSDSEVLLLLDVVEKELPTGKKTWDIVAAKHFENTGKARKGEDLKKKFKRLFGTEKPTGYTEMPFALLRAKEIKEKMEQEEVMDHASLNDTDGSSIDEEPLSSEEDVLKKVLNGTKLRHKDSSRSRRPLKLKRKGTELTAALDKLAKASESGAEKLADSINNLATDRNDNGKIAALETEISAIKENVSNIEVKLDRLIEHLTR